MLSIIFPPAGYLPLGLMGIKGAIHVGAYEAEELEDYVSCGISKIIWIEAMPNKQKIIRNKISKYPEMVLGDFAAGKSNGYLKFNISSNGMSSSFLEFDEHTVEHPEIEMISSINVEVKKIDDFIKTLNLKREVFNLLIMDVQGFELNALKGMRKQLEHVEFIWIEVSIKNLYLGGAKLSEIDEFLGNLGFFRVEKIITKWGWGDALYAKKYKKRLGFYLKLIKLLKGLKNPRLFFYKFLSNLKGLC